MLTPLEAEDLIARYQAATDKLAFIAEVLSRLPAFEGSNDSPIWAVERLGEDLVAPIDDGRVLAWADRPGYVGPARDLLIVEDAKGGVHGLADQIVDEVNSRYEDGPTADAAPCANADEFSTYWMESFAGQKVRHLSRRHGFDHNELYDLTARRLLGIYCRGRHSSETLEEREDGL